MSRKIGVIGGSFDPIHYGHLVLAEIARETVGLDTVCFMPTHIQPFKQDCKVTPAQHRLKMLELAVEDNDRFEISTVELDAGEVSYTINSLKILKKEFGRDSDMYFIMGTDTFLNLEKWYKAEVLLSEFSFIVGERPRYKNREVGQHIKYLKEKYGTDVIKLSNIKIDISSTYIKDRLLEGGSVKYLVPDKVLDYIYEKRLY